MSDERDGRGYRAEAGGAGARVRADVVEVYLVRRGAEGGGVEFLQIERSRPPLAKTWHPVMGHVEAGETCWGGAVREMGEEVGLVPGPGLVGMWALEQVHAYYIAAIDSVVMSPRFVAEVAAEWEPRLNDEHSAWRWVPAGDAGRLFVWPGQRAAVREVMELMLPGNIAREHLRLNV